MYGIVNKAIEDLVREHFGDEKWDAIKFSSGIDIDFFMSNEPYPDDITYRLAAATAEHTGLTLHQVFLAFGEWWVLRTGKEKYGGLMAAGGATLKEFLCNLPVFHNRVMLIYPKLSPPEFRVSDIGECSIYVHYFSTRSGLESFVEGLLCGVAKMYNTEATVTLESSRASGSEHAVFKVMW